jgi:hypothetical protein
LFDFFIYFPFAFSFSLLIRWNRWADKGYKKAHLTVSIKAHAFGGVSMARGIVVEKM